MIVGRAALGAAVGGIALGAIASYALMPAPPVSMQEPRPPATYPVTVIPYDDARLLPIVLDIATPASLAANVSGVVTSIECHPGEAIESGTEFLRINEMPIVAISMSTPPYRDINPGSQGRDVESLKSTLNRLGYDAGTGEGYDALLQAAIADLQGASGIEPADGTLRLESVVWMPAQATTISECAATVGGQYSAGSPLVGTLPTIVAARVQAADDDRAWIQGDRRATVWGLDVTIEADGSITDEQVLTDLSQRPEFVSAITTGDEIVIGAQTSLATPIEVASVPVPAVTTDGDTACVYTDGSSVDVEIVGSLLGSSLVRFPDGLVPPESIGLPPNGHSGGDCG